MAPRTIPDGLVDHLNGLGFALVEGATSYRFLRIGSGGTLCLSIAPAEGRWYVELAAEGPIQVGRLPIPSMPDGMKLLLSTAELVEELPRLLKASLPGWDMVPANDG